MSHRILVACGSGIATSTHVATLLKERLAERGYEVSTTQCRIQDLRSNLAGIDVIVVTSALETDLEIPIINGVPFLTGIGAKSALDSIEDAITGKEA